MNSVRLIFLTLTLLLNYTSKSVALSWIFNQKDKTYSACESIDNGGSDLRFQLLNAARNGSINHAKQIIEQVKNNKDLWSSPDKFLTSRWIDSACDMQNNTALSISLQKGYINFASYIAGNGAQKTYLIHGDSRDICAYAQSIHRTFQIYSNSSRLHRSDIEFLKEEINLLAIHDNKNHECVQELEKYKLCKDNTEKHRGESDNKHKKRQHLECYFQIQPCVMNKIDIWCNLNKIPRIKKLVSELDEKTRKKKKANAYSKKDTNPVHTLDIPTTP